MFRILLSNLRLGIATMLLALGCSTHAGEIDVNPQCAALAARAAPGYRVDSAQWLPASDIQIGPGGATAAVPAHCLFQAVIDPRESGSENLSYGVGFELRLPQQWNGRLLFQGGGGLNGVLNPALGRVAGAPSALARGFAVVSTDGGHRSRGPVDVRFGVDQQARLDFAYQAVQRTILEAKRLLDDYYGRQADYSYFMGCSTGGREAMLAAQRLPLEFDGIVAGNAAFNLTRIAINQLWSLASVTRNAPRDAAGNPALYATLSDAQLQSVANAVVKQCDALDGLVDGIINDFEACDFDPGSLACAAHGSATGNECLTATQIDTLHAIFGGARNSRGESIYGTFPYDTGIAQPAWRGMHLGSEIRPPANAILGRDTYRMYALTPANPDLDPLQVDFDRAIELTAETAAINDAVGTLHSTYADRGGKLIIYHGLSDQAMAPGALIDWYKGISPRNDAGPQRWARLFLIPGMTHCGGGQSTDEFDMLSAIQGWVERGEAPDSIIASGKAFPGRTRPLCPYPKVARFVGGDPEDAQSFSCR
ncbi:MAG: tannase/feruloyl esterase family alpha/beta hydrolase [Gammaproteobacteria bacterium]|nr:tannase/feruloyl esterase family alpha/beta hydrolase [Gammaproteobacteria bacterium]